MDFNMSEINDFIGGRASNVIVVNKPQTYFKGISTFKNGAFDSEKEDGSYFIFTTGICNYYNSSDVLQWTITANDILGVVASGFTPFVYLDGGGDTLYLDATDGTNHRLGVITISTGAYSRPGASTTTGYLLPTGTTTTGFSLSEKTGDVVTSYIAGGSTVEAKNYTVDTTTGVFSAGTSLSDSEYISKDMVIMAADRSFYKLTVENNVGEALVGDVLFPQFSVGSNSYMLFFGTRVYTSTSSFSPYPLLGVMLLKSEYIKAMNRFGKQFIDENFSHVGS